MEWLFFIFSPKEKPSTLIVSNVEQPWQCIGSEKKGGTVFLPTRISRQLIPGSILTVSAFPRTLSRLIFLYDKCCSDSLGITVLDFTLGNFFRYSASFPCLYFFSAYCQ